MENINFLTHSLPSHDGYSHKITKVNLTTHSLPTCKHSVQHNHSLNSIDMLRLILISACLTLVTSHLCFISPRQRGSLYGENVAGAPDCALTEYPCGGREGTQPTIAYIGGTTQTFTIQRNLNHFNREYPGYLSISYVPFGQERTSQPVSLYKEYDMNSTSPYLINAVLQLPRISGPTAITLIAEYKTNAPEPVPGAFYQCADITVYET
eukprot:m.122241 g.122241  ORF g.122241 m.122241 type:complete len:209 (+) comp37770_c0_seq3:1051-1677(+)